MPAYEIRPAGSPYGSEPYGLKVWGSNELKDRTVTIKGHFGILGSKVSRLHGHFLVFNRYSGQEPSIEDVHAFVTYRFMALGCLDGPLFPYYSRKEV